MELIIVTAIVLFVAALNVAATFRIHKDDCLDSFQRKAVTAFVWLVPILGALLVHYFRNEDDVPLSRRKDDGLSGFEVVDPEMPSLHDDASPGHGHD